MLLIVCNTTKLTGRRGPVGFLVLELPRMILSTSRDGYKEAGKGRMARTMPTNKVAKETVILANSLVSHDGESKIRWYGVLIDCISVLHVDDMYVLWVGLGWDGSNSNTFRCQAFPQSYRRCSSGRDWTLDDTKIIASVSGTSSPASQPSGDSSVPTDPTPG